MRATLLMVCFCIVMPVSTLAASVPLVNTITAVEIEEIVKKDISKLSPQIIQDSLGGKIPHLKVSILRDIIIYGLSGGFLGISAGDMQTMIKDSISVLNPQIVQDIMLGKIPGVDKQTMEEVIAIGLSGGISGINPMDFKDLLYASIPFLPSSTIKDIFKGKFTGLDSEFIINLLQIGLGGGMKGISIEDFRTMVKENIFSLPQDVLQAIIDGIVDGISWDDIKTFFEDFFTGSMVCQYDHFPYVAKCVSISCDSVLKCVMKKQRKTLNDRLDDLINTIKANTKQTEYQMKIIEQEVLAYRRLEARVRKEALSLKEARYLSNKIKNSVSIGSTIDTSKKGQ